MMLQKKNTNWKNYWNETSLNETSLYEYRMVYNYCYEN